MTLSRSIDATEGFLLRAPPTTKKEVVPLPSRDEPVASVNPDPSRLPPPVRAQLLATEHWSLLATRGMTWSEVMGRITVHLTIASAALVVLALVTQATGYGVAFHVLSIGLTSAIPVLGTLTVFESTTPAEKMRPASWA